MNRTAARTLMVLSLIGHMLRGLLIASLSLGAVGTGVAGAWSYARACSPKNREFHTSRLDYWEDREGWNLDVHLDLTKEKLLRVGEFSGDLMLGFEWWNFPSMPECKTWWELGPFGFVFFVSTVDLSAWGFSPKQSANWTDRRLKILCFSPPWFLCLIFAAYPLWAFVRGPWRRRRRRAKGLCVRCGYNLTGNVTGVCSECGTEVPIR